MSLMFDERAREGQSIPTPIDGGNPRGPEAPFFRLPHVPSIVTRSTPCIHVTRGYNHWDQRRRLEPNPSRLIRGHARGLGGTTPLPASRQDESLVRWDARLGNMAISRSLRLTRGLTGAQGIDPPCQ